MNTGGWRGSWPLIVVLLLACGSEFPIGVAPYGFAITPEQRFRLEGEDRTEIDGTTVVVDRYAELRVVSVTLAPGRYELSLYLDHFYLRVEGAPGGSSEVALSAQGLAVRSPNGGEMRLGPSDERPGGGRVQELLSRPVAGVEISETGEVAGEPWRSFDPILSGFAVLDWLLLALPVLSDSAKESWEGRRRVPALGQYELGVALPLRYERVSAAGGEVVRASGLLQRRDLEVAPGFRGLLRLDVRGETELDSEQRVRQGVVELAMRFEAEGGDVVSSVHRTRIRCLDCPGAVNSPFVPPDTRRE